LIYFLDTNAAIAILKDTPVSVRASFNRVRKQGETVCLPAIALFELWYGVAKSGHWQRNADRLRDFLSWDVSVIEFDEADAQVAGEIRHALSATGKPIGSYDLLIAAQALRHNATLVTANSREFSRIEGLVWEDWSKS